MSDRRSVENPALQTRATSRGFTLIEVLVALAIFAVLAAALVLQSGSFGSQLFRLEDKTIALWVAQNTLDRARLANPAPALGESSETIEMAGKQWAVRVAITDTARPGFRRVVVQVATPEKESTVIELTGFRGL
jgi:general secretion pathway protein I